MEFGRPSCSPSSRIRRRILREVDFVADAGGRVQLLEAKWTEIARQSDAVNLAFVRDAIGKSRCARQRCLPHPERLPARRRLRGRAGHGPRVAWIDNDLRHANDTANRGLPRLALQMASAGARGNSASHRGLARAARPARDRTGGRVAQVLIENTRARIEEEVRRL